MFADPVLSNELQEKIVAFIEHEAGRDAPLTADDEAMVRDLLERDEEARRFAEDLRSTNAGLDTLLDDVAAVDVPDQLVALIRGHQASDVAIAAWPQETKSTSDRNDQGDLVELRPPEAPGFGYGAVAAAASIALFVSCGALLHVYTTSKDDRLRLETSLAETSKAADTSQKELADVAGELQRLTALNEQTSKDADLASEQLTERGDLIQRLEGEQAELKNRYDDLAGENERLNELVRQRTTEVAAVDEQRQQLIADLGEVRGALEAERGETMRVRGVERSQATDLEEALAKKEQRLAELSDELEGALEQSAANKAAMTEMQTEQEALQTRLAALEADNRTLVAERDQAKQAAVEAEEKADALQANLLILENAQQATAEQIMILQADLEASTSWLVQVAQYHRIYASTARRHLVEVGADEQDHIEEWLETVLRRPIPVPDLSDLGVTFQGARLLGINEKPVAELVYLDANDQPLAFCIIPSTMEAKQPTLSTNRDLNLIDWRDGQYAYAIVGWAHHDLLAALAEAVRPFYDL
jgi:anti-sigma factor RsiW